MDIWGTGGVGEIKIKFNDAEDILDCLGILLIVFTNSQVAT